MHFQWEAVYNLITTAKGLKLSYDQIVFAPSDPMVKAGGQLKPCSGFPGKVSLEIIKKTYFYGYLNTPSARFCLP